MAEKTQNRTVAQILADHAAWLTGKGRRLVWSELTDRERADLRGADLSWADLRRADLSWADLRRTDLRWADLRGADLSWADLRWADLRWADLTSGLAIVQGPARSDGYHFSLRACCFGEHVVIAGCRSFTISEYRAHVAAEYPDEPKAAETLAILAFFEARLAQLFAEWEKSQ